MSERAVFLTPGQEQSSETFATSGLIEAKEMLGGTCVWHLNCRAFAVGEILLAGHSSLRLAFLVARG